MHKLKYIPHLKLNLKLPNNCVEELLNINCFYGLTLKESIKTSVRDYYYNTSQGHAFRSYTPFSKDAYYTKGSKSLHVDDTYSNPITYRQTESWNLIPQTTSYITDNLCDEDDLGMMCLHKLKQNSEVAWHSHCDNDLPYDLGIVHFSLVTNDKDLSEVKTDDKVSSINYEKGEGYLFNGFLQHRSVNLGKNDRIHLVVECNFESEKFKTLLSTLHAT